MQQTKEAVLLIRERLEAAHNRQRKYADEHRKDGYRSRISIITQGLAMERIG